MITSKPLRKGVCGIFLRADGKILLGNMVKAPDQWQLPQGGIELGESYEQALRREMYEEFGIEKVSILKKTDSFFPYIWPVDLFPNNRFGGQEHLYFLLDGNYIDVSLLEPTEEFLAFKWATPEETIKNIIDWKRESYLHAFKSLNIEVRRS